MPDAPCSIPPVENLLAQELNLFAKSVIFEEVSAKSVIGQMFFDEVVSAIKIREEPTFHFAQDSLRCVGAAIARHAHLEHGCFALFVCTTNRVSLHGGETH